MKKLSISALLTLAAVGVAATNIGCSSSPGTGGGTKGTLLKPTTDGFFDGSTLGVLGAWYSYGDWYGGTPTAAGAGDCPTKGAFTVDQCSAITTPVPGEPFTNVDGAMCTSGTAAKVLDMNYSAIWGAGIGFDMNNAGSDGGIGKQPYDAAAHNVTGISFHIDTPPTGGQMRVEFPTSAVTGTTDINVLFISSHKLGPVAMDLNLGYTRRSGDGSVAPTSASVWTASFGGPAVGWLGWVGELYGFPATSGPAGADSIVAFLCGPTFQIRKWLALDAGGIIPIAGPQPRALYAGVTYNVGRLWK